MRKFFVTTFVLAAMLCLATSGMALEKRAMVDSIDRTDDWNAGTACSVSYMNFCTGWLWVWSGFGDDARMGLVVDQCCGAGESAALMSVQLATFTPAPAGYGFTGTLAAHAVDANNCPTGAALASAPFLPFTGIQTVNYPGVPVPNKFAIVLTVNEDSGIANPSLFATDHPAAGPTGPVACGNCYPTTRVNHSYAWGSLASPVCPGSTFNDGICDAQLYWFVNLACAVSVEESSWGSIKNLYR